MEYYCRPLLICEENITVQTDYIGYVFYMNNYKEVVI